MLIPEPLIIPEGEENKAFWENDQIQTLFAAIQNLQFTSRDGAIQHNDKAGNFSGVWAVFTSNAVANTEDAVSHGLGRVPLGCFASLPNKAAILYAGPTAWTASNIYVKTSVGTVAWKLLVF